MSIFCLLNARCRRGYVEDGLDSEMTGPRKQSALEIEQPIGPKTPDTYSAMSRHLDASHPRKSDTSEWIVSGRESAATR